MGPSDDQADSFLGKTAPGPAPALVSGGDLAPGYVVGEYRVDIEPKARGDLVQGRQGFAFFDRA
jgi:hypothetical protein